MFNMKMSLATEAYLCVWMFLCIRGKFHHDKYHEVLCICGELYPNEEYKKKG